MLKTVALNIGYGKSVVQRDLCLEAADGEMICLIGKNGSGKSTLLRTLAGLQRPLSGRVLVQERDVVQMTNAQRATLLSLVLTDRVVVDNLTIHDLVAMGRFPYTNWAGRLSENDEKIVETAINQVGLAHKTHALVSQVSDGERQRAVIAKALAQDTPLVLLDEPTAFLDLPNRIETMLLLRQLSAETRKTFILSTHELDLALQLADRLWLMSQTGVQTGIPEDLMLRGDIERAFGNERFRFDPSDGHCQVTTPTPQQFVKIDGDNTHATWLKRALARIGIGTNDSAPITICAKENGFQIDNQEFATIAEVIEKLLNCRGE